MKMIDYAYFGKRPMESWNLLQTGLFNRVIIGSQALYSSLFVAMTFPSRAISSLVHFSDFFCQGTDFV